MTRSRTCLLWPSAALLLVCGFCLPGRSVCADDAAPQPPAIIIPGGADARTAASDEAAVLAWSMATIYAPALKAPDHPAKTQELAALTLIAGCIAHDSLTRRTEARTAVTAALAAGSQDPMLAYFDAMASSMSTQERGRRLKAIYPTFTFTSSPYPVSRRAICGLVLLGTMSSSADPLSYATMHEQVYQDILATLATFPEHEQGMVRPFYPKILGFFEDEAFISSFAAGDRMLKDLSAPGIPQWWSKILQGSVHIQLAWLSRGSGYANTVGPTQWQGFSAHLTQADTLLTAAWNLAPDRPEAAAQMITVAMGGNDDNGSIYDWFDRAMQAQMDYTPAFNIMFNALLPRWGGSWQDMIRLGTAAAQTGRYDTGTPWQLIDAVTRVYSDFLEQGGTSPAELTPQVYRDCQAVITGYRQRHESTSYYETWLATLAWMCGQQAARSLQHLTAAGDKPVAAIIQHLGMSEHAFRVLVTTYAASTGSPRPTPTPSATNQPDPVVP